jgi:predicted secreted protein
MTIVGGLALYFVIWWTVLFAVLPFGVQSQAEAGEVTEGTEPGAPVLPGLRRKALITSVIAAVVFALVWYVWATFDL